MEREFDNILVPLDGSPFAEYAVPVAATIAERSGACLRLVAVEPRLLAMPTEDLPAHLRHAHELNRTRMMDYLADIEARIRGPRHLRTTIELRDGEPVNGIIEAAAEHDADLIVMTSHGRGGLRRAWLGSVADALIRRADAPVMLIKPDVDGDKSLRARRDFPLVIVPLDGSPAAEAALEPAIALAQLHHAPLRLFRSVPTPVSFLAGPAPYGVVDRVMLTQRREEAERYLRELADRLRGDELEVSTLVVQDQPAADAIIDHASDVDGLIVIATHGLGGMKRLVLGSVADKVIRGATNPVLAVRPATVAPVHEDADAMEEWSGVALLAATGAMADPRASTRAGE